MQEIRNKVNNLIKEGHCAKEIEEIISSRYGRNHSKELLLKAVAQEINSEDNNYSMIQKADRSRWIVDMNARDRTIYLLDPFVRDIVTIQKTELLAMVDKKLKEFHNIIPCRFVYNPFESKRLYKIELVNHFNIYVPPAWWDEKVQYVNKIPPLYEKFFKHLVDGDINSYNYIIKWLANAVQAKNYCVLTAIGDQGVGKGVLGTIMMCLVGKSNYHKTDNRLITKDFNKQFKFKRLVFCDEINIRKIDHVNKFKDLINDTIEIEGKGENAAMIDNYASIYIASNNLDSIRITSDDRRFSIVDLTSSRLDVSHSIDEISALQEETNVNELAKYLFHYQVDKKQMLQVFTSRRTEEVRRASLTDAEEWFIDDYAVEMEGQDIPIGSVVKKAFEEADFKALSRKKLGDLSKIYPRIFKIIQPWEEASEKKKKRVYKVKFFDQAKI